MCHLFVLNSQIWASTSIVVIKFSQVSNILWCFMFLYLDILQNIISLRIYQQQTTMGSASTYQSDIMSYCHMLLIFELTVVDCLDSVYLCFKLLLLLNITMSWYNLFHSYHRLWSVNFFLWNWQILICNWHNLSCRIWCSNCLYWASRPLPFSEKLRT